MTEEATDKGTNVAKIERPPLLAGNALMAVIPADADQAFRLATLIYKSGMGPKDMSPEKITTAILHGLEIGLKPMQAVQSIAIINGRPSIWGDAAIGLVQGSGLLENIEEFIEGENDKMVAVCRLKRMEQASPIERRFSIDDARTAGLWGRAGPWKQYPKRMLQMRARSWALRDGFSDVLKGLHVAEEVRDYRMVTINSDAPPVTAADITNQGEALPTPVDVKLQSTARDIATLGTERMREHWKSLSETEQVSLKPILKELQGIARLADEAEKNELSSEHSDPAQPEEGIIE